MTLTLLAVSLNEKPLSQPITAYFDAKGGTIGRADHNTMALPDPERHISRLQAEILVSGARYLVKNVGAANPITVAGRLIGQGDSSPLAHGDELRIGGYLLQVIDDLSASAESAEITRGRAVVSANTPRPPPMPASTPLPDDSGRLSSNNPFADLFGSAAPASSPAAAIRAPSADAFADLMPPPAGVAAGSAAIPARSMAPTAPILPYDLDLFAPVAPAAQPAPAANAVKSPSSPFDDLMPAAAPSSLDDMYGLAPAAGKDPLADFMAGVAPMASATDPLAGELSTDPLALFGGPPAPKPAAAPAVADHIPQMQQPFVALRAQAPPAPAPMLPNDTAWQAISPPPAMSPAPPAAAEVTVIAASHVTAPPTNPTAPIRTGAPSDNAALWQAFCEGAGAPVELPQGLTPEIMRTLGQLLSAAVEGTLQLMAVRTTTKQELHAAVTMIQQRANNPLKFSPDARSGIEQLLRPPMRGFLAGPAAMSDAMHDLLGHSIGTMAGMRAALDGVLGRFAPADLDTKLSNRSLLDSVLPMNRKARLWDLYLQHFEGIREEAQEDFDKLFGKAFLAAYEQQLERLRQGRKP